MCKKFALITGTRPQIIKTAPILREVRTEKKIRFLHIFTGQHYDSDLADIFFDSLNLESPTFNLDVGSGNSGYHVYTIMRKLIPILEQEKPIGVLVPGDTNSALAAGLVGMIMKIPILHLESGLRSYDLKMQEEINRRLIDHGSSVLFAPTKNAINNLNAESVLGKIVFSGDTMCDLLIAEKTNITDKLIFENHSKVLNITEKDYLVLTIHRRENLKDPAKLRDIFKSIKQIKKEIIFPIHPHTKKIINLFNIRIPNNVKLINPLGYQEFLNLVYYSGLVMTDSGGLQKEAYLLEVPCLTLRNSTEWIETVEKSANRVVGTNPSLISQSIQEMYQSKFIADYGIYGDGKASKHIIRELLECDPFIPTVKDL